MEGAGHHACSSNQHRKACAKHAHAPPPRVREHLHPVEIPTTHPAATKQLKIEIDEKNNEKNNQENATTPAIHETSIETSSLFRPLRPQPKQNVETPMLKLV